MPGSPVPINFRSKTIFLFLLTGIFCASVFAEDTVPNADFEIAVTQGKKTKTLSVLKLRCRNNGCTLIRLIMPRCDDPLFGMASLGGGFAPRIIVWSTGSDELTASMKGNRLSVHSGAKGLMTTGVEFAVDVDESTPGFRKYSKFEGTAIWDSGTHASSAESTLTQISKTEGGMVAADFEELLGTCKLLGLPPGSLSFYPEKN